MTGMQRSIDFAHTALRMIPWPTTPGLVEVGDPGRDAPVLVTTNCAFTVRRLLRELAGEDCFVLVAPSQGVNVWCGAVGGHFDRESVVSILKTSRIADRVDHRRVTLPLLAAPSIRPSELRASSGWSAQFGPMRAEDIGRWLSNGRRLLPGMTTVTFGATDRRDMALAMTGSIVVRFGLFALLLAGLPGLLLFVAATFLLSSYEMRGEQATCSESVGTAPAGLRAGATAGLAAVSLCMIALPGLALGGGGLALAVVVAGAAFLTRAATSGYMPFKQCSYSKTFYGVDPIAIEIVSNECIGCDACAVVCPTDCFGPDVRTDGLSILRMERPVDCIECGACLTQCPTDAVINAAAGGFIGIGQQLVGHARA